MLWSGRELNPTWEKSWNMNFVTISNSEVEKSKAFFLADHPLVLFKEIPEEIQTRESEL